MSTLVVDNGKTKTSLSRSSRTNDLKSPANAIWRAHSHLIKYGHYPTCNICVSYLTSIDSDNGLSPGRRQAIIRTNAGILLIRPLGRNFNEFLVEILMFSFKKMRLKVSSAKRRPFCLGLNGLMAIFVTKHAMCMYDVCAHA